MVWAEQVWRRNLVRCADGVVREVEYRKIVQKPSRSAAQRDDLVSLWFTDGTRVLLHPSQEVDVVTEVPT